MKVRWIKEVSRLLYSYYSLFSFVLLKNAHCNIIFGEPDYRKLEYGGILRQVEKSVSYEDKDVRRAVQYGYDFVKTRFPFSVPLQLNGTEKVSDVEKINLIYTLDEDIPVYKEDLIRGKEQMSTKTSLSFGVLYKFKFHWQDQEKWFIHKFIISMFPRRILHVYLHNFYISVPLNKIDNDKEKLKWTTSPASSKHTALETSDIQSYLYLHIEPDKNYNHWLDSSVKSVESCHGYQTGGSACVTKFSVMTYNTWNMNSVSGRKEDYVNRIKQFGELLSRSKADIIGFQEVRYEHKKGGNLGPNQVQHLANTLTDYQFVFQPAQLQPNSLYEGRTEEGVAIFSRFPVISSKHLLLFRNRSNSADMHQRVCLHAVIQHPAGKINMLTTHLSLSHEAREKSVIQICKYIRQLSGPVIFLGDLNAEPEEPAIRFLRGEQSLERENCKDLTDLWLYKHGKKTSGLTFSTLTKSLSKRIDYMFMLNNSHVSLVDISIPDDGLRGMQASSDHLPVLASFSIRRRH